MSSERGGVRTHPLLEVLSDLVVELELLINVLILVLLVVVLGGRLGRGEEAEERVGGDDLLDDPGLVGVCTCASATDSKTARERTHSCCAASWSRRAR